MQISFNPKTIKKSRLFGGFMILSSTLFLCSISAQDAFTVSGGEATGNGGFAGYSIGQVFISNPSGNKGHSTEGVQQPYEISVATDIIGPNRCNINCTVYPNPACDYIILQINDPSQMLFIASLYDMNGRLLERKEIKSRETYFSAGNLPPASYLMIITHEMKETIVFRIVKD